jgi:hypothetical protein
LAIAIGACWLLAISPYLENQEAIRQEEIWAQFQKEHPKRFERNTSASGPTDDLPFACQKAHYDASLCKEQREGNAQLGNYLLNQGY